MENPPLPMPELNPSVAAVSQPKEKSARSPLLVLLMTASVALMVVLVFFLALKKRTGNRDELKKLVQADAKGREIEVAQVKRSPSIHEVTLVGEARPYYDVTLFARVSGYLVELRADVGDRVRKGQLLARVESPEAEQAYNSARADSLNKTRIADRYKVLLQRQLVSRQEAEQAFAVADIAQSTLRTQAVIKGYEEVRAPFDGTITQRYLDPGALIQNASSSQAASQPLFAISQVNRLRILGYVDQKDAASVRAGDPVEVELPDPKAGVLKARIERISGQLDDKTRTLLTEVILENPDLKIVPGSFLRERVQINTQTYLELPAKALVMKGNEAFVPLVSETNEVHYQKIDLAENDGVNLLIRSGVEVGQKVALDIGNSLQEGQKVQVKALAEARSSTPSASGSSTSGQAGTADPQVAGKAGGGSF